MIKGFFGAIGNAARWIARPLVGFIQENRRKRRESQARAEALRLDRDGHYAGAAAIYTRIAGEYFTDNPLIFQLYSHFSFAEWLKAKKAAEAMQQAGDVLRVLSDTGWLGRSREVVDDLSKMVGELYVAGYLAEAARLAEEINRRLAAQGLPPRQAGIGTGEGKFPSICPQCGGALPSPADEVELKCPYCGTLIHAV